MNIPVESSLAAWLRATPAFDGIPVHTGQSAETIPQDQSVLLAGCESTEAVARGFYKATASIVLVTPAVLEGSLEAHTALAESLRSSLLAASDLADAFAPALTLAGADLRSVDDTQSDGRWVTTAALTLAFTASGI
ncbi:MAG: hypothetical protein RL630_1712 [Verrucomicrobiota bacterium]